MALAKDRLKLDVDDFETAVRIGRRDTLEDAFGLYRGEFLEGLESASRLRGVDADRAIPARRGGGGGFCPAARTPDYRGDTDAAVETARRLVALTPLDEEAHARLIQLYGSQGRRGWPRRTTRDARSFCSASLGRRPARSSGPR